MLWLLVYQFMFFLLDPSFQYRPTDFHCARNRFKMFGLHRDTFFMGTTGCEVIDRDNNVECAICGFKYGDSGENNVCNHNEFFWIFDYYEKREVNKVLQQSCKMMNHCKMSYAIEEAQHKQLAEGKNKTNFVNYICGTETKDGKRIQKGKCWSVYGTYVCECKPPNQGRDCNDAGAPEGAYATGVQVLLDTRVRVSDNMPILIAVKDEGHDFKVHVNLFHLDNKGPTITITEPTVVDRWSTKLIKHCVASFEKNEYLKKQCSTYLKGSSSIYSLTLRFPLERDDSSSLLYYDDSKEGVIPIGYYTSFTVTTTNSVRGVEKVSFVRTNYDPAYNVFVRYPVEYMDCYGNPKIVNCDELRENVDVYIGDSVIVLYGSNLKNYVHKVNTPECTTNGDETIKWKIMKVMPDGNFQTIEQFKSEREMEFFIKPFTFQNGIYLVEFSYSMLTKWDVRENFDRCFFKVVEAPIIAIIEGGSSRYVDVATFVILDGSGSHDPNVDKKKSKEGLSFRWSCELNRTKNACLQDYLSSSFGSSSYVKLPPNVLEAHKEYTIELNVKRIGKTTASVTSQTLFTGNDTNVQSVGIICLNCMDGKIANPTDYIYLLVKLVLKPRATIKPPFKFTWTFASHPVYQPDGSVDGIRVNHTSQDLLKIDKNKLEQNQTYRFRAATVQGKNFIFSDIDILIPEMENFTCSLTPDSGVVAVTNFSLNCTKPILTFEVFDKSSSDPKYYSGRMLFTDLNSVDEFKLANKKLVVYGYNDYKMIQEWVHQVNLTPFDGNLKDIDDMVRSPSKMTTTINQKRFHSASLISAILKPAADWFSISLLKRLITLVYKISFKAMQYTKLVLSSIEFILVVMSERVKSILKVKEAKKCADIISALARDLFARVKRFNNVKTLTETILHQMIRSLLNVIEIVLSTDYAEVLSKPLYLVNPYVLRSVKDTTYELVDALYKMSSCLLWRQIQGDSAKEIISTGSKITTWAMVHRPEVVYGLRGKNKSIPFHFSGGFFEFLKDLDVLGIQVTNIKVNPFWWARGDINTNILLVDICFKVNPTQCRYHSKLYKAPLSLYFNTSQVHSEIKPLEMHTVYLNSSKDTYSLDMAITVYRFDPPPRAKLFIQFEFENSTEQYKVLFSINRRPDFELMEERGVIINNENQSNVKYLNYIKDDSDKLYYMGIFPVHEGNASKRAKFKLKIEYAVCKTWLRLKWASGSCWVGEQETIEQTLICDCYHLSMFAGAVQVPTYQLNPALQFTLFLTEEFNWLPLIVLTVIILTFLLLYVWGMREDCKDPRKGLITILEDNYPGESYAYLLGVYTGSRINSSTDANVGIRVFGDYGTSRAHILKHCDRPTLRSNTDDWFLLYCPVHLGTLVKVHLWHDNSGKSPDWFVEKIEVYDLTDKLKYIFELNIWLALEVNEYPEAVVTAYSVDEFYSCRQVFLSNVRNGFSDNNYWTSIFWKHARNPIKRVHRICVVLCYVMVTMICTVIIYHFNKRDEYEEDEPSYKVNYNDLIISIITLSVASFTTCLVMFLFRKSFSVSYMRRQSSLFLRPEVTSERSISYFSIDQCENSSLNVPSKQRFIKVSNETLDEKKYISFDLRYKAACEKSMCEKLADAIHYFVRGSTLEPVRLSKFRNKVNIHQWYFITAWTTFVVFTLGGVLTTFLFGHRIPKVESEKWVTVVLCVLVFDAVILSTLKILVCSTILGFVFQRVVPAFDYQVKPKDGVRKHLFGDVDHFYKLTMMRSHPMYCPLHGEQRELLKQKCVRRERGKTRIYFVVILMLILVLFMLISSITTRLYSSNAHAAWMLTKGTSFHYQNFTSIYNRTTYSEFFLHNFVDRLHRYLWYTQEDALKENDHMSKNSWTYDCTTKLLGNARIRQLRVVLGKCSNVDYFEETVELCSPPWSSGVEDVGTYGRYWFIGGIEDSRRKSSAWRYTDAAHPNTSVSYGPTLTSYPSGGFIEELGSDNDDIQFTLSNLFSQNWLDHMTRAVFVELTLYNVNTGLFTQVILVAEQMPTGEYLVAVKAESVNAGFSFDIWIFTFCVLLIFFLVRMCVLINRNGIFVHFSKIINVFEGFLLSFGFLTIYFYLMHITSSSDYVKQFLSSGTDKFFYFSNLKFYIIRMRVLLFISFVCVVIRLCIVFRFVRIYLTFYHTLLLLIPSIVWLVLYLISYLAVVRRLLGYLLNVFVFPYNNLLIIHYKNPYASLREGLYHTLLVILMCLSSYVVFLLFIASFWYNYRFAKVNYLMGTDMLNPFTCVKEDTTHLCKKGLRNKETDVFGQD